jgi:hypothetical protein
VVLGRGRPGTLTLNAGLAEHRARIDALLAERS